MLVDVGLSRKKIVEKLKLINIDPNMINVILLTHEHSDHLKGANVLLKDVNVRLITTRLTAENIKTEYDVEYVCSGDQITLNNDVSVDIIKASHDALDTIGFIFHANGRKFVHITDTGYILNENYIKFQGAFSYTIESNYEEEVLIINEKYPFKTKQRILSEVGHLSNIDCHEFLKANISEETKFIQFAHLSENNNNPELVAQLNETLPVENKKVLLKDEIIEVELCK